MIPAAILEAIDAYGSARMMGSSVQEYNALLTLLEAHLAPDEGLLNPDMPAQELRLHMGELKTDEMLVARAAIRWANSRITITPREEKRDE